MPKPNSSSDVSDATSKWQPRADEEQHGSGGAECNNNALDSNDWQLSEGDKFIKGESQLSALLNLEEQPGFAAKELKKPELLVKDVQMHFVLSERTRLAFLLSRNSAKPPLKLEKRPPLQPKTKRILLLRKLLLKLRPKLRPQRRLLMLKRSRSWLPRRRQRQTRRRRPYKPGDKPC